MEIDPIIRVDIPALLGFFDEAAPGSPGHASAIVAMAGEDLGAALVARYLQDTGVEVEILLDRCTQGTRSGCRLDRWILARGAGRQILYQTEIKNWSAHAIGGRRLRRDATASETARYKVACWEQEWTDTGFRKKVAAKVLTPMKPPLANIPVEPLICFWTALHPQGALAPWFTMPLKDSAAFSEVSVFSMSSYLRSVSDTVLELKMPAFAARREWIDRVFPESRLGAPAV